MMNQKETVLRHRPRAALVSAQTALLLMAVAGFIVLHTIRNDQDLVLSASHAEHVADAVTARTVASIVATACVFAAAPGAHISNTLFLPQYKMFQPFAGKLRCPRRLVEMISNLW